MAFLYEYFWAHRDKIIEFGEGVACISLWEVVKYMSIIHIIELGEGVACISLWEVVKYMSIIHFIHGTLITTYQCTT